MSRRWSPRLLVLLAVVAGLFVAARFLPLADWVRQVESFVRDAGPKGPALFVGVYILATLFLIPGSLLTLSAGGLFGTSLGTITVSVASTVAAALAFLIARFLGRRRVMNWIRTSPRLSAADAAIQREGWKMVALLRLSPAVPFTILNYFCGVTAVPFRAFVLTSWIAMFPATLLYTSLGAAGADLAARRAQSAGTWTLRLVGIAATVVVTVVLTRRANRLLKQRLPEEETDAEAGASGAVQPTD